MPLVSETLSGLRFFWSEGLCTNVLHFQREEPKMCKISMKQIDVFSTAVK